MRVVKERSWLFNALRKEDWHPVNPSLCEQVILRERQRARDCAAMFHL